MGNAVIHLHDATHFPCGSLEGVVDDEDQIVNLEVPLSFGPFLPVGQQRDVVGDPC